MIHQKLTATEMANHYVLILGATWRENALPQARLAVTWWVILTQQDGDTQLLHLQMEVH